MKNKSGIVNLPGRIEFPEGVDTPEKQLDYIKNRKLENKDLETLPGKQRPLKKKIKSIDDLRELFEEIKKKPTDEDIEQL